MSEWVEVPFGVREVPGAAGGRLDNFLAKRIKGSTRTGIQRMVEEGRVRVEGRPGSTKASTKVGEDDSVVVRFPRREDPPALVSSLSVLYEDTHLLVVDKPAGVLSHPTDKVLNNSVTAILAKQFPGGTHLLAHRLDRETSGVLVLTKDSVSARRLQEQFERRQTAKEYLALVSGKPSWEATTVDLPLAKAGGAIKVRQAALEDGAPALTQFTLLSASDSAALVLCRPRTGRLHQIRVHLAHLGHPILGDLLYSGDGSLYLKAVAGTITSEDRSAPRQMLHANSLSFRHPVGGAALLIEASVPSDFVAAMRSNGVRELAAPTVDPAPPA